MELSRKARRLVVSPHRVNMPPFGSQSNYGYCAVSKDIRYDGSSAHSNGYQTSFTFLAVSRPSSLRHSHHAFGEASNSSRPALYSERCLTIMERRCDLGHRLQASNHRKAWRGAVLFRNLLDSVIKPPTRLNTRRLTITTRRLSAVPTHHIIP
jgi:hypothetical protein